MVRRAIGAPGPTGTSPRWSGHAGHHDQAMPMLARQHVVQRPQQGLGALEAVGALEVGAARLVQQRRPRVLIAGQDDRVSTQQPDPSAVRALSKHVGRQVLEPVVPGIVVGAVRRFGRHVPARPFAKRRRVQVGGRVGDHVPRGDAGQPFLHGTSGGVAMGHLAARRVAGDDQVRQAGEARSVRQPRHHGVERGVGADGGRGASFRGVAALPAGARPVGFAGARSVVARLEAGCDDDRGLETAGPFRRRHDALEVVVRVAAVAVNHDDGAGRGRGLIRGAHVQPVRRVVGKERARAQGKARGAACNGDAGARRRLRGVGIAGRRHGRTAAARRGDGQGRNAGAANGRGPNARARARNRNLYASHDDP